MNPPWRYFLHCDDYCAGKIVHHKSRCNYRVEYFSLLVGKSHYRSLFINIFYILKIIIKVYFTFYSVFRGLLFCSRSALSHKPEMFVKVKVGSVKFWVNPNYFSILASALLFHVHAYYFAMGNSHNSGYSSTIQSDRHSEGGQQNVDTEALKKTLKVRISVYWNASIHSNVYIKSIDSLGSRNDSILF